MSSTKRLLFIFAAILLAALCSAAVIYSQEGPQLVLVVHHSAEGKIYVIPQSQVYFTVAPMPETHPAPHNSGDWLICREHDVHFEDGSPHLAFRCGSDDYVMKGLGVVAEKKEQK